MYDDDCDVTMDKNKKRRLDKAFDKRRLKRTNIVNGKVRVGADVEKKSVNPATKQQY